MHGFWCCNDVESPPTYRCPLKRRLDGMGICSAVFDLRNVYRSKNAMGNWNRARRAGASCKEGHYADCRARVAGKSRSNGGIKGGVLATSSIYTKSRAIKMSEGETVGSGEGVGEATKDVLIRPVGNDVLPRLHTV